MSGVLVISPSVYGHPGPHPQEGAANYQISACDQYPRPSQEMFIDNNDDLRALRQRAAVLGQILGVPVIDTTR